MKQMAFWLAFAAVISALGLWPSRACDAAELLPAQVLVVDASKGEVRVEADCGVSGSGRSLDEALEDMKRHAPGELFLDTAEHVVLCQRAWYLLPQAASSRALRPAAKLCRAEGELPGAEQVLAFLQAHPPQMTLARAYAAILQGETIQTQLLRQEEGRLCLAAG